MFFFFLNLGLSALSHSQHMLEGVDADRTHSTLIVHMTITWRMRSEPLENMMTRNSEGRRNRGRQREMIPE